MDSYSNCTLNVFTKATKFNIYLLEELPGQVKIFFSFKENIHIAKKTALY